MHFLAKPLRKMQQINSAKHQHNAYKAYGFELLSEKIISPSRSSQNAYRAPKRVSNGQLHTQIKRKSQSHKATIHKQQSQKPPPQLFKAIGLCQS